MTTQTPAPAAVALYAGFWRRAAAFVTDAIIMSIANGIAGVGFGPDVGAAVLSIVMDCAYVALFLSSAKQATPGKMLFGIKVTDLDGERIGVSRAVARYFAGWLSMLLLLVGFLMAAFTPRKQALHDIIVGTLVVAKGASPEEVVRGGATMRVTAGVAAAIVIFGLVPIFGGLAAIAMHGHADYTDRSKVSEAMAVGSVLKTQVAETLAARQPIKSGPVNAGGWKYVREASIAPSGEITVRLVPTLGNGGSIVFTPTVDAAGNVTAWQCHSPDAPKKILPAACR